MIIQIGQKKLSLKLQQLIKHFRLARQLQLGWEVADRFGYEDQAGSECYNYCQNFNNETEFIIKNLGK